MKFSARTFTGFILLANSYSALLAAEISNVAYNDNKQQQFGKLSKDHFVRLLAGQAGNDEKWLEELEETCDITNQKELQDLRKFRSFFIEEFLDNKSEAMIDEGTLLPAIDTFFNTFDSNRNGYIDFNEISVLDLGLNIDVSSMLALFKCIAGNEMKLTKSELRRAFVVGDPHFATWQGARFNYHGECDLVMIQNPSFDNNRGLDLHIRTEQLMPEKKYSYVSDVALRIGDDILEVNNDGSFLFNGKSDILPATMGGGFPLTKEKVNDKCFKIGTKWHCTSALIFSIQIGSSEEEQIEIKAMKNMLHVDINGTPNKFEGSAGVMGTYGRMGHGRIARDGTTVIQDADKFVQEWQVRSDYNDAVLFHTARFPQFPQECVPPSFEQSDQRHLRAKNNNKEEKELEENARIACKLNVDPETNGDMFKNCIFDVMVTGDLEHASVYGMLEAHNLFEVV